MNNIINWLLKPFKNDFSYFILILILISSIDIYDFISRGFMLYSLYLFFNDYLVTYLLCLITNIVPSKLSFILKIILTIIVILLFIADIISLYIYHQKFTTDFLTIFIQTNYSEAKEFIETYISPSQITIVSISLFILLGSLFWTIHKHICIRNKSAYLASMGIVLGIILTFRNPTVYKDAFIGRVLELNLSSVPINVPYLKEYQTQPQITYIKERKPQNIVMLIGESFSKSHSSLYGYTKSTNPRLTTIKDSLLFVYNDIKSASTGTFQSIRCIMSTYKPEYKDSIEWYKCITLPAIMQTTGYQTYWISNQSKIGIFDTGVGRYADLCNYQHFVGDKFAGLNRTDKDEAIIDLLQPLLQDTSNYNMYFIQLMGSHQNFKHRYPNTFDIFKKEDYQTFPEHQRENLASYDNSILYNDSVVYEIMNLFHDKEAIIFYFSDHAIDVYESTDDFIGHARSTDPKSVEAGSRIPFMIYTSPLYQQNFPSEMEKIKQCTEQPFRTDDMIYTIMDIIGVTFEGESLEGKSLFQLSR